MTLDASQLRRRVFELEKLLGDVRAAVRTLDVKSPGCPPACWKSGADDAKRQCVELIDKMLGAEGNRDAKKV